MLVSARSSPTPTYTHIPTGCVRTYVRTFKMACLFYLPATTSSTHPSHPLHPPAHPFHPPVTCLLHPPATPPPPITRPLHPPVTHTLHPPATPLPLTCSRDQNIDHWCYFLQSDHFEAVHAAERHRLGLPWQPAARLTNRNTAVCNMLLKATLTAQHMATLDRLVCTCKPHVRMPI